MTNDGASRHAAEGPAAGSLASRSMIGLVQAYRLAVSPVLAPSCRYWPSCSEYAIEALQHHGAWRGGLLATRRLLRCTPWHAGGVDPVPPALPSSGAGSRSARPRSSRPFSSTGLRWRAYREPPTAEHPTTDPSSR